MSLDPSAVQQGAAKPLTAESSAHDQAQMQTGQGTSKASFDLESPPQHSHAQTPSSDLGAGSPLPHPAPRNVDNTHQSQAAAAVTSDAQDLTAIPTPARIMNPEGKWYQRKTFNSRPKKCESVA